MRARSELEFLAEGVCKAAKEIENYRLINELDPLSFNTSRDGPTVPQNAPEAIHEARQTIIDNADRIQQLALDPADVIPALTINVCNATFDGNTHLLTFSAAVSATDMHAMAMPIPCHLLHPTRWVHPLHRGSKPVFSP